MFATARALLFAPRCAACAGLVDDAPLCAPCASSLTELGPACPRCAEPFAAPAPWPCRRCRTHPLTLSAIHSPWRYGGALADALQRLKFARQGWVARTLAPLVAPYLTAVIEISGADAVVPVPLHWTRRARRGFDQVALLLEASRPPVPIVDALRRRRGGAPLSTLPASARRRAVAGAFTARQALAGRRVVLVDDVATTGATLDAAARALRAAECAEVIGFAAARAAI